MTLLPVSGGEVDSDSSGGENGWTGGRRTPPRRRNPSDQLCERRTALVPEPHPVAPGWRAATFNLIGGVVPALSPTQQPGPIAPKHFGRIRSDRSVSCTPLLVQSGVQRLVGSQRLDLAARTARTAT